MAEPSAASELDLPDAEEGASPGERSPDTAASSSCTDDGGDDDVVSEGSAASAASAASAVSAASSAGASERRNRDKDEAVQRARREFHGGRYLHVKYLPHEATEEDLRKGLQEKIEITEILINKRTSTAKVYVERPEILETWPAENFYIHDQMVEASPSFSENVLCVVHLPLIYSEEDFQNLAQMYGPLVKCFLMKSEITGNSKGYGFIEYTTKEIAHQARTLLDRKAIGNCSLRCDWLDPSCTTYKSLHSKCLFVDHLPSHFHDVNELRSIFSTIVKPLYCQLIVKKSDSGVIGLIEFDNYEEAEDTQQRLNGYQLEKHKIRVTFCIPGIHAITLFNKINVEGDSHEKQPLLPDPVVNPALLSQLQVLAMQNPQFFQNLQSLVSTQLQNLQNNNQVQMTYQNKKTKGSTGLLGSPPSLNSNPNVQAAALLLLATQTQMRLQQPSLLGNPFLVSQLQNLIKHDNNNSMGSSGPASNVNAGLQTLLNQLGSLNKSFGPCNGNGGLPLFSQAAKSMPGQDQAFRQNLSNNKDETPGGRNSLSMNNNFQPNSSMQSNKKTALLPNPNGYGNSKGLLPTPGSEMLPKSGPCGTWSPMSDKRSNSSWDSSPELNAWPGNHCSPHNGKDANAMHQNGMTYSKVPLLGDKPKGFEGFPNKVALLGDKPGSMMGNNMSQHASMSSFGDSTSENNFLPQSPPMNKLFSPGLNGSSDFEDAPSFNDAMQSSQLYDMRSRQPPLSSPLLNNLLPSPGSLTGLGFNRGDANASSESTSPRMAQGSIDAVNLSQLNNQLEKLGNNPLISLLLQAAQTNTNLPTQNYDRIPPSGGMYDDHHRSYKNRKGNLSNDEAARRPDAFNGPDGRPSPYSSPSPKRSLLGPAPMPYYNDSSYNPMHEIRSNNGKGSLLGDYPGSLPVPNVRFNSNKSPMHSSSMTAKRKFHSLLPSPEDSPKSGYVGQHSQGLGGHYADSYHKKFRK